MFFAHFSEQQSSCSFCRVSFDLWDVAISTLTQRSQLFRERGLAFLGACHAFFSVELKPDETLTVRLADYGVPETARILYAVYTPCGRGVLPMEWRSNEMDRPRDRHTICLFARKLFSEDAQPTESSVDFSVTFIEHSADEYALSNLAGAYERFLWDDYGAMVMPAFVAVEDTLRRVLDLMLKARGLPAAKRIPFEAQLGVLLPLLSEARGFPKLPSVIVEQLGLLRKLRNELGHEGRLQNPPTLEAAAKLLCSAIFAYRYLKLSLSAAKEPSSKG
jgi:hypothetical protein